MPIRKNPPHRDRLASQAPLASHPSRPTGHLARRFRPLLPTGRARPFPSASPSFTISPRGPSQAAVQSRRFHATCVASGKTGNAAVKIRGVGRASGAVFDAGKGGGCEGNGAPGSAPGGGMSAPGAWVPPGAAGQMPLQNFPDSRRLQKNSTCCCMAPFSLIPRSMIPIECSTVA